MLKKNREIKKMAMGNPRKQWVSTLYSLKTTKVKDFALRRKPESIMFQSDGGVENLSLRIGFRVPNDPVT